MYRLLSIYPSWQSSFTFARVDKWIFTSLYFTFQSSRSASVFLMTRSVFCFSFFPPFITLFLITHFNSFSQCVFVLFIAAGIENRFCFTYVFRYFYAFSYVFYHVLWVTASKYSTFVLRRRFSLFIDIPIFSYVLVVFSVFPF